MVVFTCGHCGESVTKPKVEKHYQTKCRNRDPNLSCMDCFKDFYGDAYQEHIKCITEEQRYAAKGFVAKEKKGEQKQNAWVELVQSVLDEEKNATANVLRILNTVSKHNNTPRKKPKFINFVKNVCGHKTHPKDIDAAWDLISVKLTALSNKNQKQNGTSDVTQVKMEEEKESNDNDDLANDTTLNGDTANGDTQDDKKSKKQRKEEKKRQKYEAAIESAAHGPTEEEEETEYKTKKEKKKNKESNEADDGESKKNKKRKRLDTTNSVVSTNESDIPEAVKPQANGEKTEKTKKKKPKVDGEEDDGNANLHDQNVAGVEQLAIQPESFNWHAVIISVLEKKGNELPFKRLQKKVLSEYSEVTGYEIDDRIADKFIKKLKSAPNVRVDKNRVTLID